MIWYNNVVNWRDTHQKKQNVKNILLSLMRNVINQNLRTLKKQRILLKMVGHELQMKILYALGPTKTYNFGGKQRSEN